jgi:hypothetical protein
MDYIDVMLFAVKDISANLLSVLYLVSLLLLDTMNSLNITNKIHRHVMSIIWKQVTLEIEENLKECKKEERPTKKIKNENPDSYFFSNVVGNLLSSNANPNFFFVSFRVSCLCCCFFCY